MDKVYYVEGIPRWFTYCLHWRNKRRYCRKFGHRDLAGALAVCDYCGELLGD